MTLGTEPYDVKAMYFRIAEMMMSLYGSSALSAVRARGRADKRAVLNGCTHSYFRAGYFSCMQKVLLSPARRRDTLEFTALLWMFGLISSSSNDLRCAPFVRVFVGHDIG